MGLSQLLIERIEVNAAQLRQQYQILGLLVLGEAAEFVQLVQLCQAEGVCAGGVLRDAGGVGGLGQQEQAGEQEGKAGPGFEGLQCAQPQAGPSRFFDGGAC